MNYSDWLIYRTIELNPYIPIKPTPKQLEALKEQAKECFYGGAAGGGKSIFLLMAALQFVEVPTYAALILRKTYKDLSQPSALIPISHDWLSQTDAKWHGADKYWSFPSGAVLQFGHMEHEESKRNYQGAAFNFIGFDELPHFSESQYRYLFSRLRKGTDSVVPSRIRSTGNPDGVGFQWVKQRFVDPGDDSRPFISSKLEDNPHLNIVDYEEALKSLDPITYMKLRQGDWTVRAEGNFFKCSEIEIVDGYPKDVCFNQVRRWDLAASAEPKQGSSLDPDYTVGLRATVFDGTLYIIDVCRGRWAAGMLDKIMCTTAINDGFEVRQIMEEEAGSSGKITTEHFTKLLAGYSFEAIRSTGKKEVRAIPVAAWVNQGRVKLVKGKWNEQFLDELSLFPLSNHDDQVDTLSGAFHDLTQAQHSGFELLGNSILNQYQNEGF